MEEIPPRLLHHPHRILPWWVQKLREPLLLFLHWLHPLTTHSIFLPPNHPLHHRSRHPCTSILQFIVPRSNQESLLLTIRHENHLSHQKILPHHSPLPFPAAPINIQPSHSLLKAFHQKIYIRSILMCSLNRIDQKHLFPSSFRSKKHNSIVSNSFLQNSVDNSNQ